MPLNALITKNTLWHFDKRELWAFESMKKALYNPLCLVFTRLDLLFSMECNVSNVAVGALLS